MNLVVELPPGPELPYREAFELSMPQDEGDHLVLVQRPPHRFGRVRVSEWVAERVHTSTADYTFPRLVGVGESRTRARAQALVDVQVVGLRE